MKILISQMKPYLGDMEKNLKKMIENIEKGISENADVVVFPELSLNGTLLEDIVYDAGISAVPEKIMELSSKITIIFGGVKEEKGRFFNCGYCVEYGRVLMEHKKVFLSNGNGGSESKYFTRGKEFKAFDSKRGRFAIALGEEGINPMVNAVYSLDGAEVVFNLINEGTIVNSSCDVYESFAVSSAVYNKFFVVTANRVGTEDGTTFCGKSFAVSPYGKIIEKLEQFSEKLSIINIDLNDIRKARCLSSYDNENNMEVIKKELERLS